MLTPEQMRQVTLQWQPQFHNPENFEKSITRFLELTGDPTAEKAHNWLAKDQAKDELLHTAAPREPSVPVLSRYDLNGCYHCYGRGWVRIDSDIPQQPQRCPACHGRDGDQSTHCAKCADFWVKQTDTPERNQCFKCRQYEDEPAGESCTNPGWHIPHGQATGATPEDVVRRF